MKIPLLILTVCVFVLVSCAENATPVDVVTTDTHQDHEKHQDHTHHLGCQEGEIVKGECVITEHNNAELFGRDLTNFVTTQEVDTQDVKGFLARPKNEGTYPAVVMIHEWWGLNDNIKEMARILAHEGYVVFAIDLYNGEVGETSDQARTLATSVRENPQGAVDHMRKAVSYLKSLDHVDSSNIGSMGWCFGGQQSLNLAISGEDMQATVIYYGHLTDDKEELAKITWPVLGVFGQEDTSITVESVNAFETALSELGIENDIHIYPGVGHAFANPSGSRYAPDETRDAWTKTVEFLDNALKS